MAEDIDSGLKAEASCPFEFSGLVEVPFRLLSPRKCKSFVFCGVSAIVAEDRSAIEVDGVNGTLETCCNSIHCLAVMAGDWDAPSTDEIGG